MTTTNSSQLSIAIAALNEIGIPAHVEAGARGFIEGVRIEGGELYVDPAAPVSGLLHEAGHLACVPKRFRHYVGKDLGPALSRMFDEIKDEEPESPLYRAMLQCSDPEATAWAYAFGTHLGFSPEEIILDSEYANAGEDVRMGLVARAYVGINGLAAAGFCVASPMVAKFRNQPLYPKLIFWTQEL